MKLLAAALALLPSLMVVGVGHSASPLYDYDERLSKIARETLWQAADEGTAIRRGRSQSVGVRCYRDKKTFEDVFERDVRRLGGTGHRVLRGRARHPPARLDVRERPPLLRRAEHRADRRRLRDPPPRVAPPAGLARRAAHDVLRERSGALGDALVRGQRGEGAPSPQPGLHVHSHLRAAVLPHVEAEVPRADEARRVDQVRGPGRSAVTRAWGQAKPDPNATDPTYRRLYPTPPNRMRTSRTMIRTHAHVGISTHLLPRSVEVRTRSSVTDGDLPEAWRSLRPSRRRPSPSPRARRRLGTPRRRAGSRRRPPGVASLGSLP